MTYEDPLFYRTSDSGTLDILFLHGLLGSSHAWNGIVPSLLKKKRKKSLYFYYRKGIFGRI